MATNRHYVANGAATIVFTFPAGTVVGDVFTITGLGEGGFMMVPGAGQALFAGGRKVAGYECAGGGFTSANPYDTYTWQTVAPNAISLVGGTGTPSARMGGGCK